MELGRDGATVTIPVSFFDVLFCQLISICSYEKELNGGARPALRLIAAQDVSAGLHMILCVSDIVWSGGGMGDDGLPLLPHPSFELTDGWYRLRARVDEVLARAARRGVICVGRKISVSGALVRFQILPNPQGNGPYPYSRFSFRATPNHVRYWKHTTKSNLILQAMAPISHLGMPSLAFSPARRSPLPIHFLQKAVWYPVSNWL